MRDSALPDEKNAGSEGDGMDTDDRLLLRLLNEKTDANPFAASESAGVELSCGGAFPGAAGCFALGGITLKQSVRKFVACDQAHLRMNGRYDSVSSNL